MIEIQWWVLLIIVSLSVSFGALIMAQCAMGGIADRRAGRE
jgi:hypothetical protein